METHPLYLELFEQIAEPRTEVLWRQRHSVVTADNQAVVVVISLKEFLIAPVVLYASVQDVENQGGRTYRAIAVLTFGSRKKQFLLDFHQLMANLDAVTLEVDVRFLQVHPQKSVNGTTSFQRRPMSFAFKSGNLHRPYITRLTILILLLVPSTKPLLKSLTTELSTASKS